MKTETKNKKMKFYTIDQVFKKASKSPGFQKTYDEEMARLGLARQIREIRLKKKLTQKAVALKTNMPQSVIARIESGTHSYSLGTLHRIAHAFNKEIQLA
ncbi:MAG: helix-turn-helix transcriptional regulator [bacterium]|nr:helix-turn-helix transcriptional regulator [bacterium]